MANFVVPDAARTLATEKGVPWESLDGPEALGWMQAMAAPLRSKFKDQGHVFRWLDAGKLNLGEAAALCEQLAKVDVEFARSAWTAATKPTVASTPKLEPLPSSASVHDDESWRQTGLDLIRRGQAAALVLAGGQGTRLGYDGPKGCFDLALPTPVSLFELFATRLRKLAEISHSETHPRFLVMTSDLNDDATREYFEKNNYFGLTKTRVHFFPQGTMPAVDLEASNRGTFQLHLESPSRIATAPNGNGGIYAALKDSKMLDLLVEENVLYIHLWSVDNALSLPCDPVFLGYAHSKNAAVASKVVAKRGPTERVGVLALKDGKPAVVEYSELSDDDANRIDSTTGKLVYRSGNICNHALRPDFVTMAANASFDVLPYHVAKKAVSYPDPATGAIVKPSTPNAIKLETFIFDAFTLIPEHDTLEVDRADDFAPVKNQDGSDSPGTAVSALLAQGQRWLQEAGASIQGSHGIFVPPGLSYAGEGLEGYAGVDLDTSSEPLVVT